MASLPPFTPAAKLPPFVPAALPVPTPAPGAPSLHAISEIAVPDVTPVATPRAPRPDKYVLEPLLPQLETAFVSLARQDVNVFIPYVMRDEETGARLKQSKMHTVWHRILDVYKQVVLWSHVNGGKSTQIPIGRVLFELGRNKNLRIAICASTQTRAKRLTQQLGRYIESSEELHTVFPELRMASKVWSPAGFNVVRDRFIREPSVQALGYRSSPQGARLDLLIIDDILTFDTARTPELRAEMIQWVRSMLFTRMEPTGRIICIGNAFHPEDLLHTLEREKDWHAFRFPVMDAAGNSTWPEKWTPEAIENMRNKLMDVEFARQMMCMPRTDADSRFKQSWIDACFLAGRSLTLQRTYEPTADEVTITGVDLAVSKSKASGESAWVTFAYNHRLDTVRVLDVQAGRFAVDEIAQITAAKQAAYRSEVVMEDNGQQDFAIQVVKKEFPALTVNPHTTGKLKHHPEYGVEGIAMYASKTRLILPGGSIYDPQLSKLVQDMLFYTPAAHTGDRLMAFWIGFARLRRLRRRRGWSNIDVFKR